MSSHEPLRSPHGGMSFRALLDGFSRWLEDQFALGEDIKMRRVERVERALAFADVVVLAALADGEVSSEELALIHRALERFAEGQLSVEGALSRWRSLGDKPRNLEQLKKHIRYTRDRLSSDDRKVALALVKQFVSRGSGAFDPNAPNYRTAYQSSPGALLEAFEYALWN